MAYFVRHVQCPNCAEAGQDTSKDNLAIYSDGSSWCFACNTYTPPAGIQQQVKKPFWQPKLVDQLPEKHLNYLRAFLSDGEIRQWFKYSKYLDRHVFSLPNFWYARAVDKKPKTLHKGLIPFYPFGDYDPNLLIIVEDIISAICVSRAYNSLPLFGSHFPLRWVPKVVRDWKRVKFWLDKDKAHESIKKAEQLNSLIPCGVIITEKDPKYYKKNEILDLVGQHESQKRTRI